MWSRGCRIWTILLPGLLLGLIVAGSASISMAQDTPGACPIGGYAMPACPMATDAVIRDQVISRISGSVATAQYPVVVGVCNGIVTLRGEVQNMGKKNLATIFASGVKGVVCVVNQLTIDVQQVDDLILIGEVKRALAKAGVNSKRVRVDVSDSVVELSGVTTSEMDRDNATGAAAAVPGVTAVYNGITVYGPSGTYF